jgi:hypothetical protein
VSRQNCMRIMPMVGVLVVSATRATSTLKARMARYASRDGWGMNVCRTCDGASAVLSTVRIVNDGVQYAYFTRFAQYALARFTSASEGVAASLRHGEAWNCLLCNLEQAWRRRIEGVKFAEGRIEKSEVENYRIEQTAIASFKQVLMDRGEYGYNGSYHSSIKVMVGLRVSHKEWKATGG